MTKSAFYIILALALQACGSGSVSVSSGASTNTPQQDGGTNGASESNGETGNTGSTEEPSGESSTGSTGGSAGTPINTPNTTPATPVSVGLTEAQRFADQLTWPVALTKMVRHSLLFDATNLQGQHSRSCDQGELFGYDRDLGGKELRFQQCIEGIVKADGLITMGAYGELGTRLEMDEFLLHWDNREITLSGTLNFRVSSALGSESSRLSGFDLIAYQGEQRLFYHSIDATVAIEQGGRTYRVSGELASQTGEFNASTPLDIHWNSSQQPYKGTVKMRDPNGFAGVAFDAESGYVGQSVMVQQYSDGGAVLAQDFSWKDVAPLFADF